MFNIMIVIDGPESRKNNFLVVKGYYSKTYKVNKDGRYCGASISEVDLFECMQCENIDHKYVQEHSQQLLTKIGINSYYLPFDKVDDFMDCFTKHQVVFLDNTDKRMFRIDDIRSACQSKASKYKYQVGPKEIIYDKGFLVINDLQNSTITIKNEKPMVKLIYNYDEKTYQLCFSYKGDIVAAFDKKLSTMKNSEVYLRNYAYEIGISDVLVKDGFVKLLKNKYRYVGHLREDALTEALEKQDIFTEYDEDIVIPNINIKKRQDGWFELDLTYSAGDRLIDLSSRIQLFSSRDEIKENGARIVLPESIIEAKDSLVFKDGKLCIDDSNVVNVLRIINDSKKSVQDFFSYADIKLNITKASEDMAYNYQLEGIKWLKYMFYNGWGGCLADDMGLGKTFQVITFLSDKDVKSKIDKVLVIAPKSLLSNWKREFAKFHSDYQVGLYHGPGRDRFDFEQFDVVITTYNTASLDVDILNKQKFSIVIFDEIQMLKNSNGEMSKTLKKLSAGSRIGLSGTPMENNISELWNIMDILNPGVLGPHKNFAKRYSMGGYSELKTILDLFIMRRMKHQVIKELPDKTTEILYCDMDEKQRELYEGITVAVRNAIASMKAFSAPIVLKGLTLLRQCCCHPLLLDEETNVEHVVESCKMDSLVLLLKNLWLSGHKVLVFSTYTSMLKLIQNAIQEEALFADNVYYLDGQTTNRSEIVDSFEASDEGVFLISMKAGGVGLNLVSAQDVVIFDPWWNPFAEEQAIDRAYRIGQVNNVHVYKFVVADSIEERIIEMQNDKMRTFDDLINGISTEKNVDLKEVLKLI